METSRSVSSSPTPREMPRFGLESQSNATTARPWRARVRAMTDEVVVLPEPPLPTTASFILCLSGNSLFAEPFHQGFYRPHRRTIGGKVDRRQLAAFGLGQLLVPRDRGDDLQAR